MKTQSQDDMSPWKKRLYKVIYEAETPSGKVFDVVLLISILVSVVCVVLESVDSIEEHYGSILRILEWVFTIFFTLEYALRIICIQKPRVYIFSFFGVIDFLALIPTYLSLYFVGFQSLMVIRTFRLLRVFRVLKLMRFLGEAAVLWHGLRMSIPKIIVFLGCVFSLSLIVGTMMYIIEGPEYGFTSIPRGVYWAIVTVTTVGYGDISPHTVTGQLLASVLMILGYGIIAVPAGIVSAQIQDAAKSPADSYNCPSCSGEGLGVDSTFCRFCGEHLNGATTQSNLPL